MESVNIRYGQSLNLDIDTGDTSAVSADIYVGKPGQLYVITSHTDLVAGLGTFEISDTQTQIPLDTYYYQVNVNYASGGPAKYPSPDDDDCSSCGDGVDFPEFVVAEALDQTEVS